MVESSDPMNYIVNEKAAYNSNPTNPVTFIFGCNSADGNTNNFSIAAKFEVTYWADMCVPKNIYVS
jgi:hypothetical protein